MAETGFHVTLIAYVISMLRIFFRHRGDVYVGGNIFLYYEEGNAGQRVSPDVFVVFGVSPHERRSWRVWEEGKGPDVVFEFTSRGTRAADLGTKKGLYEWLGVQEYFLYDPLGEYLKPRLQGFQLRDSLYQPMPRVGDKMDSALLGLTLQAAGEMLRFTNTQTGEPLLLPLEEAEAHRAEAEARHAEAEARRAAESEVARLREELDRLRGEKS